MCKLIHSDLLYGEKLFKYTDYKILSAHIKVQEMKCLFPCYSLHLGHLLLKSQQFMLPLLFSHQCSSPAVSSRGRYGQGGLCPWSGCWFCCGRWRCSRWFRAQNGKQFTDINCLPWVASLNAVRLAAGAAPAPAVSCMKLNKEENHQEESLHLALHAVIQILCWLDLSPSQIRVTELTG